MAELELRPMTETEFAEWDEAEVREYADVQVAAGVWAAGEALELSRAQHRAMLPAGPATEGMLLRVAIAGGIRVGTVWIGLAHPRGTPDCAFLYVIEVEEGHRGKGYGRALLGACEDLVAAHGIGALELNVFGHNTTALRLYETSGYHVVTQQMRKAVGAARTGEGE